MTKYLLAYHGGKMAEGEAEQAKVLAAWGEWFQSLGAAVVDGGAPVGAVATIATDGATSSGGGANPVTGYSLITASDLDAALGPRQGLPGAPGRWLGRGRRDHRDVSDRRRRDSRSRRRRSSHDHGAPAAHDQGAPSL